MELEVNEELLLEKEKCHHALGEYANLKVPKEDLDIHIGSNESDIRDTIQLTESYKSMLDGDDDLEFYKLELDTRMRFFATRIESRFFALGAIWNMLLDSDITQELDEDVKSYLLKLFNATRNITELLDIFDAIGKWLYNSKRFSRNIENDNKYSRKVYLYRRKYEEFNATLQSILSFGTNAHLKYDYSSAPRFAVSYKSVDEEDIRPSYASCYGSFKGRHVRSHPNSDAIGDAQIKDTKISPCDFIVKEIVPFLDDVVSPLQIPATQVTIEPDRRYVEVCSKGECRVEDTYMIKDSHYCGLKCKCKMKRRYSSGMLLANTTYEICSDVLNSSKGAQHSCFAIRLRWQTANIRPPDTQDIIVSIAIPEVLPEQIIHLNGPKGDDCYRYHVLKPFPLNTTISLRVIANYSVFFSFDILSKANLRLNIMDSIGISSDDIILASYLETLGLSMLLGRLPAVDFLKGNVCFKMVTFPDPLASRVMAEVKSGKLFSRSLEDIGLTLLSLYGGQVNRNTLAYWMLYHRNYCFGKISLLPNHDYYIGDINSLLPPGNPCFDNRAVKLLGVILMKRLLELKRRIDKEQLELYINSSDFDDFCARELRFNWSMPKELRDEIIFFYDVAQTLYDQVGIPISAPIEYNDRKIADEPLVWHVSTK